MNIVDNRRARLKHWIDTRFDGKQVDFIAAANEHINQGEISNLLKNKSFGEKKARKLETQANMPTGYLDQPMSSNVVLSTSHEMSALW